jgi:ABC-type phosphate/phosphonate transport system substrate-binding protein
MLAALFAWTGCSQVESFVTGKEPVRIGLAHIEFSPPPFMLPKRTAFFRELSVHLNQPVQPELMMPRQIRVHLGLEDNRIQFAMLSPGDYAEISKDETHKIVAIPINSHGQTYRRGLIIVGKDSPIRTLAEIKAQRFHFMPGENPLNDAALGTLMEGGLTRKDISEGFFGLDTHHINSLEVAKSVVFENMAAGVIDEADYQEWPESGGSFVLLKPSKDQVRVIGQTVKVYEGPIVTSIHTPPELVEQLEDFLLNKLNRKGLFEKAPLVLAILGCEGFAPPVDPAEYEPFSQLYRKLYPDPIYAETMNETTAPAEE